MLFSHLLGILSMDNPNHWTLDLLCVPTQLGVRYEVFLKMLENETYLCRAVRKQKSSSIFSQLGKRKRTLCSSQSNELGNKLKERRYNKCHGLGADSKLCALEQCMAMCEAFLAISSTNPTKES